MKITSNHAILDIKRLRGTVRRGVENGEVYGVVITGTISGIHGNDDGISQEFVVDVSDVKLDKV